MRHDLASFALFVRIAETKSITKAAAASHLALAAASRRIAQLEARYGVELLYRTSRGAQLTPAGQVLLVHARLILGQANVMMGELSDFARGARAVVRIQANTSVLAQFLPQELASFADAHPGVKFSLEELRSHEIAGNLRSGATDIGLVLEGTPLDGLQSFAYRSDRLVAVVPRRHPLKGRSVAYARLLDFDFVGMESSTVLNQLLTARAVDEDKPLRLRMQVKSFDVVARMVEAGLGIGILPDGAARSFASTLGLRLVPLADDWALRRMYICVRDYATLPVIARELVDHLVGSARGG